MRTIDDKSLQGARVVPAAPGSPRSRSALLPWAWAGALCVLYSTVAVRRHLLLLVVRSQARQGEHGQEGGDSDSGEEVEAPQVWAG